MASTVATAPQERFPVTNVLLLLNIAVFLVMAFNHVSLVRPSSDQVLHWGANYGPLSLDGQPWRILTNIFVHIGLLHIISNMWALFVLGRLAETLYGRAGFLLIYLCTGITGTLTTLTWNPLTVSAGASGALMGLVGALVATLFAGHLPLPRKVVRLVLATLVFWGGLALAYGFWNPGGENAPRVDNAAHVGGVLAGLIIGYAVGHHLGPEGVQRHLRWRAYALMGLILVVMGVVAKTRSGYIVDVERARIQLMQNKPDDAMRLLQRAIARNPKEAYVHLLLADAYSRKANYAEAEKELKVAIAVSPKTPASWANLGEVYTKQERWEDAAKAFAKGAELSNNPLLWYNAGTMYSRVDQHTEALQAFQKAVQLNPFLGEAWYAQGISQLNLKQVSQAIQSLQKAVQLNPNNPDMHLWLGNALLAGGKEKDAQTEFVKAFQIRAAQQKLVQQQLLRQQQARQKALGNVPQQAVPQPK